MKLTTFVAAYQHVLFACFQSFQVFRESVRFLLDCPDDVSTRFAMKTRKVNKFGRSHHPGATLDQDFRYSIDRIISDRGDRITGYIVCVAFALHMCKFPRLESLFLLRRKISVTLDLLDLKLSGLNRSLATFP